MFKHQQRAITHALLTATALIIIGNYLYRQPLYAMGVELILNMQAGHSPLGQSFFQIITMLSEPAVVMVGLLVIFLGETRRKHAFNVTVFLLMNIYLITLLKEFYLDPRPFWTHPEAKSLGVYCPGQYGNPSGHSWFATVFSFLIFLKYFPRVRKAYALGSVSLVIILVALSRMYLGAHSLNQVALGVSLGMAMNVLYYICGLDDQISAFLENFNLEPMLGWKKYMLLFHGLYFLAYIHAQNVLDRQGAIYNKYHQRTLQQCGKAHTPNAINFAMFIACAILVNFITGFALGYQSMSLCERGRKYLQGSWEINQQRYPEWIGKGLYYTLQLLCLCSGMAGAYLVVQLVRLQKWAIFLIWSAGAMLSGYLYTAKCCKLLYRCSIICEIL